MRTSGGAQLRLRENFLIDDEGELWPCKSLELRRKLFCASVPGDLSPDVIRNLGFIGVRRVANGLCLRLHSRNVATRATAAAIFMICDECDTRTDRIVIQFEGEGRPAEVKDVTAAIERLGEIDRAAELDRRVQVQPRDLGQLPVTSSLRPMFELWLQTRGTCDLQSLKAIASKSAGDRFLVVSLDDHKRLLIEDCGSGFRSPDPSWVRAAPGQIVDEQHDVVYFNWVAQEYRATMLSGRAQLADIDARILWPRIGTHRVSYRRLLLPCIASSGRRLLFLANAALPDDGSIRQKAS